MSKKEIRERKEYKWKEREEERGLCLSLDIAAKEVYVSQEETKEGRKEEKCMVVLR